MRVVVCQSYLLNFAACWCLATSPLRFTEDLCVSSKVAQQMENFLSPLSLPHRFIGCKARRKSL